MSGTFSVGGLMSGLNSTQLISQLVQLERQPILRIQDRISRLESQRESVRGIRTQLTSLRSVTQNFRLNLVFDQFRSTSSAESVLTSRVSGQNPVMGSYDINVTQLASATVATSSGTLGAAINPNAPLNSSGMSAPVTGGVFTINGQAFTINPDTQSLNDILAQINSSAAGVIATYDPVTDKVTLENDTPGNTSLINLGATSDDSDFLRGLNLIQATQSTGGNGATVVTSTRNLGAVDPNRTLNQVSFRGGAVTSGTFRINGAQITVDASTDTIGSIVGKINESDAGVLASYDTATDTIRVVSRTLGSRTVGFTSGTSNFLDVTNLTTATQAAGRDAEFSVNGGPAQTRNTNEISDAIGGITLNLLSVGTSAVTVEADDDAIVAGVQAFIEQFNATVTLITEETRAAGNLAGDSGLRIIESYLRTTAFSRITGVGGVFTNLLDVGLSTGDTFVSDQVSLLQLDEAKLREALRTDRSGVKALFTNTGQSGVADQLSTYIDQAASPAGFLNERVRSGGSMDRQIDAMNGRIERMELRITQYEARLRAQFSRLEQFSAQYQSQNTMLSRLNTGFATF